VGAFKAKGGFEALVGLKTVAPLAREYTVPPTQVTHWKATIRGRLPELLEAEGHRDGRSGTTDRAVAPKKIGPLTVDLDWLKKKSKPLGF